MEDVTTYLRSKALDVYRAAGNEVTTHCLFCADGDTKGKGKLYVNTESWLFDCKRCGERGGKKRLLEFFGDEDDTKYEPGTDPARRRKVLEEYTELTETMLLNNEARLLYLLHRGLSAETISDARLGYAPMGTSVVASLPSSLVPGGFTRADLEASGMQTKNGRDFHQGKITLPYLSSGSVIQVRGKDPDGKYFTPTGDSVRLYNSDALRGAETAFLTEGEFDALIVQQHLHAAGRTDVAVVGIPGAGSLPGGADHFADYFEQCKRVYIGLDPDDVGKKASVQIKALIGAKARALHLPDDDLLDTTGEVVKCDWTEFLRAKNDDHPFGGHTATDVLGLMADADMAGKRVYTMADAGMQWAKEDARGGIKLGFPVLDAIIRPGLKPGNLVIPLAKTGTGKTVFLCNVAHNMRQYPFLFISLEMLAAEVYDIFRRVARFHNPLFDDAQIQSHYPLLRIVDENRLRKEDFAVLVEEFTQDVGLPPRVAAVDYLGYYAKGMPGGSAYEKTSFAALQLKEEGKTHRLSVIAPHQVSRGAKDGKPFEADDARDSGVVEETGDFVFGLFKPGDAVDEARKQGVVTDALGAMILKSRKGGKGRTVNLSMSMSSLAIVDASDRKNVQRIQQENASYNRGIHYDDIYADQRREAERVLYESNQLDLQITGERDG